MAAQNSVGIQTLLESEKEAGKIVQRARQYRIDRLKEARKEAEKDIQALKQQKVAEYAKFEKENSGNRDAFTAKIDLETEMRLNQTVIDFNKNKEKVVSHLMNAIVNVQPKLHQNALKNDICEEVMVNPTEELVIRCVEIVGTLNILAPVE